MSNNEEPRGVVYDVGYRPYEGEYKGRLSALSSLAWDDFKYALGVKRSWKYKVGIFLLAFFQISISLFFFFADYVFGLFPEITSGELAQLMEFFTISSFYEASVLVFLILGALAAPSLMCNDRKFNVYPLYMARPIFQYDYLLAKASSIFGLMAVFVVIPGLLLFLGRVALAEAPIDYLAANLNTLVALFFSGVVICLFYTAYSMGISSMTTTRGYAIGIIIGLAFLAGFLAQIFYVQTQQTLVLLIDFQDSIFRVSEFIFNGDLRTIEFGEGSDAVRVPPLSIGTYLSESLAVVGLSIFIIWNSFMRETS
jgi:hypothetical protein